MAASMARHMDGPDSTFTDYYVLIGRQTIIGSLDGLPIMFADNKLDCRVTLFEFLAELLRSSGVVPVLVRVEDVGDNVLREVVMEIGEHGSRVGRVH